MFPALAAQLITKQFAAQLVKQVVTKTMVQQLMQTMARSLVQQMGMQLLQQAAQQLNLGQSQTNQAYDQFNRTAGFSGNEGLSANDMASARANGVAAFNASGGYTAVNDARQMFEYLQRAGASPSDIGTAYRDYRSAVADAEQDLNNFVENEIFKMNTDLQQRRLDGDVSAVMNGKGSILMKLAIALGKMADQKVNDMANLADRIGKFGKVGPKQMAQYNELNAQLQAHSQELSIVSKSIDQVLKSIGEAASTIARKG